MQSSLSANEGPEEGGPVGANSSLWGGQASRPAIRHAQFRGAAPYPVVDASFISFTPPPTAGFTRYTASPLQTKPAAQPLAALLPYGCGVPLAGAAPCHLPLTREAALSVTADAVPAPPQGEPRRSKKPVIARRSYGPTWQSVTPVPWPPCERPIPLIKGKCPEGTKGIGLAVSEAD